jgi:hypothetical protein
MPIIIWFGSGIFKFDKQRTISRARHLPKASKEQVGKFLN